MLEKTTQQFLSDAERFLIGVVRVDDEYTLKRIYRGEDVQFLSHVI